MFLCFDLFHPSGHDALALIVIVILFVIKICYFCLWFVYIVHPIRVRSKHALPKSPEFPKLPLVSLETYLQLCHLKKKPSFTKFPRDLSVRQKHGFRSQEDGGVIGYGGIRFF